MIIYKTTNIINGKYYIGKDINNSEHYLGSGVLLKRAIKKYGKENFIKEILEHCETLDVLDKREKFWIKELNSISLGYNLTDGGTGGDTFTKNINKEEIRQKLKKRIVSEEVKKIKLKNLTPFPSGECHPFFGKKQTEETKSKRKNTFLENGYTSPMKNKNHTEESKQKIRNKKIGIKFSDETKLKMSQLKKGKSKKIIKCPYCNKEGGEPQMYQWHFNNCKFK
jgi:group I intron endonuclease